MNYEPTTEKHLHDERLLAIQLLAQALKNDTLGMLSHLNDPSISDNFKCDLLEAYAANI